MAQHRVAHDAPNPPPRYAEYVFDNSAVQTETRFRSLAAAFDPGTIRHLTE
jgi:hypothetical protein